MAERKKQTDLYGGAGRYEASPESNKVGLTPEEVFESEAPQEGLATDQRPRPTPQAERPKD